MCLLGSRVGKGTEEFVKVDLTYPTNFARLAKDLDAKYYGLLSSTGASSSSLLLYPRTKGQAENAVKEVGVDMTQIMRPGLLRNRDGDARKGEKFIQWLGVGPQIEAVDMGFAMLQHAIESVKKFRETGEKFTNTMENKAIVSFVKEAKGVTTKKCFLTR